MSIKKFYLVRFIRFVSHFERSNVRFGSKRFASKARLLALDGVQRTLAVRFFARETIARESAERNRLPRRIDRIQREIQRRRVIESHRDRDYVANQLRSTTLA